MCEERGSRSQLASVLTHSIICSLLTVLDRQDAKYAFILSIASYFSLFPLLFEVDLLLPRYSLYGAYVAMMYGQLERLYKAKPTFHLLEWLYMLGFIGIPIYEHLLSRLLGLHERLPFMPLLLTSVYSALGVLYFYVRYYLYALDITWQSRAPKIKSSAAKRKRKTK